MSRTMTKAEEMAEEVRKRVEGIMGDTEPVVYERDFSPSGEKDQLDKIKTPEPEEEEDEENSGIIKPSDLIFQPES